MLFRRFCRRARFLDFRVFFRGREDLFRGCLEPLKRGHGGMVPRSVVNAKGVT